MTVRDTLLQAGVKNLREFGYPNCSPENILKDDIYRTFFKRLLEQNRKAPGAGDLLQEIWEIEAD